MSARTILWASVAILVAGAAILTLVPTREGVEGASLHWVVPVAYFAMLAGAGGLVWGWYRKNRI